ncbi:SRPBCC family protein [Phytoactinopolyspora halotolerans]|uniref:SRPBCC domain-containing protein n=1 Tax=Phytoactinopolyspora halotolerans TaxID=1981512 RepID=A0A6L9S929_9ACTN|nr:SRPBCC domain-containing protein [Phytoactinopolyspora halotolerans]NEE01038.1 SRPBCC domain-containing protein [Phytoactinopolyspora halotolerans]
MAEYTTSIEIDAAPEEVFDFLVTDAGMTAWMGQHASLDARPGGDFAVDIAGYAVRGQYVQVDRPRRVVVSWGVAGSPDLPPGTSQVEFTLTPTAGGTRVDLTHSGLPDDQLAGHADGWTHFLPRLRVVALGGDAGDDDWTPLDTRTTGTTGTDPREGATP